jgi:hypothetical protein
MAKLIWVDTSPKDDVTAYDGRTDLEGHKARVYCYTRFGARPWTAEAGGRDSNHRTRELAEAAAERRLRAAAVVAS